MNKTVLLVVQPNEDYIKNVAQKAVRKGLVGSFLSIDADVDAFAAAMKVLDKNNLIIAKGMCETADIMRLILKYNDKELIFGGSDGFLSHCAILRRRGNLFRREKRLVLTDAALNIVPDAEAKVKIAKNAINFTRAAHALKRPVLSILTAAGKLNPAIRSSTDGEFVMDMLTQHEDAEIRFDALDTAVSATARRIKKMSGPPADILLASDIDSGNAIWKMHTMRGRYDAAGLICGCTVPIVVNSRSDTARSKLFSIRVAKKLSESQK